MLLPGFIDAHAHASAAGLERLRCDLSGAHGLDDYLTILRRYAEARPDAGWITGGGWAMCHGEHARPGRRPDRA
jgi:predicted amidohydrolase YtcJ